MAGVTLVETVAEMSALAPSGTRAVVMTMGALHRGHADLLTRARQLVGAGGEVVATIFVNPLQFAPGEDFDRYPRTWDTDLEVCRERGVDIVFAPSPPDMYPDGWEPIIGAGATGDLLEGAVRPGHFDGMLTVVNKLLNITQPHQAIYGEKDYQQLVLIRRMVRMLNMRPEIIGSPTVREPDGLALSSRNTYLTPAERQTARVIPRATAAAIATADIGGSADEVRAAAAAAFDEAGVIPDYVALTDPQLGPAPERGEARLLVAARIGIPRLIDNVAITLCGTEKA